MNLINKKGIIRYDDVNQRVQTKYTCRKRIYSDWKFKDKQYILLFLTLLVYFYEMNSVNEIFRSKR